jgi:hypothetical protein
LLAIQQQARDNTMNYLRQSWSDSKTFRVILIAALVYVVLRLAIQGVYLVTIEQTGEGLTNVPIDLKLYIDAASRLQNHLDLYTVSDVIEVYQYTPSYALAFTPFLLLSPMATAIVHTILHILAYGLLYITWGQIFRKLGLNRANEVLAWSLPVWLLFSAFWDDLGYLNIYIIMALFGTLFIDAILNEHLGRSLLWLSIILQIKPHWAFAAAIPVLLGRYRFFFKLLVLAVITYAAVVGVTVLIVGPSYGWQQFVDYIRFLSKLSHDFPWRGPDKPFLGYNHSITQSIVYWLGISPNTFRLAAIIKIVLLAPLGIVCLRDFLRPIYRAGHDVPRLALDLAFALYLGTFVWLDMVWEVSLGTAILTYLLATLEQKGAKILVQAVFLPYALLDPWRIVSFILSIGGLDIVAPGPYILTDPYIYAPLIMVIIVIFYALLVTRLWVTPIQQTRGVA